MRKNILITIFLLLFVVGAFYLGSIFGIHSHSKLQESKYPFYLREIMTKNMPTCSDYKRISNIPEKMEIKSFTSDHKESIAMIVSADKSDGNTKLLVSILNPKHEQYFEEIYLDCSR
jgi:hypothetical protein